MSKVTELASSRAEFEHLGKSMSSPSQLHHLFICFPLLSLPELRFFSLEYPLCRHVCPFSHARLFATPWRVTCQAPLSMGFPRQEYWSGLPFPSPGDLPNPGIEPTSLRSPALAGRFFTTSATWEAQIAETVYA